MNQPSKVSIIPVLKDNYSYILRAPTGEIAIIDPGEGTPVISFLKRLELTPTYILLTHHHGDHIDGVRMIKENYPVTIYGPRAETQKIGMLDEELDETITIPFGKERIKVISTPGHTKGHIVYYLPSSNILFSGDTLFIMGCGRLFEGTPHDMFQSFQKLKALPDETLVYCGHEYTLSGARFSRHIEPDNPHIQEQMERATALQSKQIPTVPSTIDMEKKTNVFMRAKTAADFAELRRKKDIF